MKNEPKRQTISSKVERLAVVVALVISIVVGVVGSAGILIVNQMSQQTYTNNVAPLIPLGNALRNFGDVRLDIRGVALGLYDQSQEITKTDDTFTELQKNLDAYAKNISSDVERQQYTLITNNLTTYKGYWNQIKSQLQKGGDLNKTLLTTSSKYAEDLESEISKEFDINSAQAKSNNDISFVIFLILIGAIIAVVVISFFIVRRLAKRIAEKISHPVVQMIAVAEQISKGQLDVDVSVDADDETLDLAQAFQRIINTLTSMHSGVQELVEAAVAGKLGVRADATQHQGDFKQIVEGINQMLDAIKEPLDVAVESINNLSKGVHQDDLENNYQGTYAVLIDDLNGLRCTLATLLNETTKLGEAGKKGDLQVRADVSGLQGIFVTIVSNFNDVFDGLQQSMDDVIERLTNIANGSTNLNLENPYQGYPGKMVDTLLMMYQALYSMVEESTNIAQHAKEGDFSVRGSLESLNGSQIDVVKGFNDTLDAFAEPVQEAMAVLSKMAVNDLQTPMSENYQGAMKELAQSVNMQRDRLLKIENVFISVAKGNLNLLETYKTVGKRSENDHMVPAIIHMMQSILDVINESHRLSDAASQGDLTIRGDVTRFEGKYADIIDGMNHMMEAFDAPIQETVQTLKQLASGNLTVQITTAYSGQYNAIKEAINRTASSLNELMRNITTAAEEVAVGADQVSEGSQALSQGATEQAASLEELSASITTVASQTSQNASGATHANELALTTQEQAEKGNAKMAEMLNAMHKIDESSSNISKIIKTIDEIAFQTNILALNAAVEAARAGQYGKGFAVVAEEVRNLAAKSAQAAKNTTELIADSTVRVQEGARITNETVEMLKAMATSVHEVSGLIGSIASASNEQATAITEINQGLAQISNVVQTNSATAEESAASSEELSGQADTMKQLVGRFQL